MKKIILTTFVFAILFYACGGGNETSTNDDKTVTEKSKPDGAKLYQTANCATCHGGFGKPVLTGAKDLTDATIPLERRIEVITNGSKSNAIMVAFSSRYSDEEIKAIAEYTMTFVEE